MMPAVLPFHEHGARTPLLLLHGLGMANGAFALMEPLLGETCQLIMPDFRGHGQSHHPTWWQRMVGKPAPGGIRLHGTQPAAWTVRRVHTAGGGRRMSPEAAALCAGLVATNDRHHLADALHRARQFDSSTWVHTLQVPALVQGKDDDVVPEQAQMLAKGIPGARCRLFAPAWRAWMTSRSSTT